MKKDHQKIIKSTINDLRKLAALLPAEGNDHIDREDVSHNLERAELAVSSFPNATEDDKHLSGLFIHALRGLVTSGAYGHQNGLKVYIEVHEACSILTSYCPVFATRFKGFTEELILLQHENHLSEKLESRSADTRNSHSN
jgi:hypothetical protein